MDHRTYRGRIDYITDNVGITGREWFIYTIHTDGARVMRATTAMDDGKVLRDIVYAVDKDWLPLDCTVRVMVNDRFQGSGWFRFTEDYVECETYTADAGRITQRWPTQGRPPLFVNHAVACDAWTHAVFDLSRKGEVQTFYPRLTSSPARNGSTGPLIGDTTTMTPEPGRLDLTYLGEEKVTVPAGTFDCHRLSFNQGKIPRFETWSHGEDHLFVQIRSDLRSKSYVLAELAVEQC